MSRSRRVVLLASLVVAVGLAVALGAFWLDPARAAVGPLPAAALVLPGDSTFVVGVDVKRLSASSFYKHVTATQSASRLQALRELEEKTGINAERDVDQVILAGAGARPEGRIALVTGTFDRSKVGSALEESHKATWKKEHGTTIYLFGEGQPDGAAVAFLEDGMLVMGSPRAVSSTVASHASGATALRSNTALMALVAAIKPGSTFWMVGDQDLLSQLPMGPGPGGQLGLPGLKSLTVTADLDPVVAFDATGTAADEAGAKNLADMVRGFAALLTMQAQQKPELKDLAAAISVSTDANQVHVTGRFPQELIERLQSMGAPPRPQR
jgi:hypothetical protein